MPILVMHGANMKLGITSKTAQKANAVHWFHLVIPVCVVVAFLLL